MNRIMLRLDIVGPQSTGTYESYLASGRERTKRAVGAHVTVWIDGALVIEGQADPDSIDSIAEAIEAATHFMPYEELASRRRQPPRRVPRGLGDALARARREDAARASQ